MTEEKVNTSRVQINVPIELKYRMDKIFRWGEWNNVGVHMITWLCDMHDKYGDNAYISLRTGDIADILSREHNCIHDKKKKERMG